MKKLHKKLRKVAEHIDLTHLNQVKHLKLLAITCQDYELAAEMRGFERVAEHELAESSKFTTTPEPGSNLDKVLKRSGWSFTESIPSKDLPLAPLPEYIVVSDPNCNNRYVVKTYGATPIRQGSDILITSEVDHISLPIGNYRTGVTNALIGSEDRKYGVAPQEFIEHFKACEEAGEYVNFEYTYKELAEDITGKTVEEEIKEEPTLLVNSIKTPDGTILTSRSRHDFVCHEDKVTGTRYCIDGGVSYRRLIPGGPFLDLSVYSDDPFEKIREGLERVKRDKNFDQPLKWVKLKDMSDAWLSELIPWIEDNQPDNKYKKYYLQEIEYRKEHNIKVEE